MIPGRKPFKYSGYRGSRRDFYVVNDLFYNTPVRKKYLKSDTVELARIIDAITG